MINETTDSDGDDFVIDIIPAGQISNSQVAIQAKKFTDLLKDGIKPGKAADMCGTTLKKLMSREDVTKLIEENLRTYHMSAEVDKLLVRASRRKVLVDNMQRDDKDSSKLVLEAARDIASDPAVGLTQQQSATLTVDIKAFKKLIEEKLEMPFIEADVITEKEEDDNDKKDI